MKMFAKVPTGTVRGITVSPATRSSITIALAPLGMVLATRGLVELERLCSERSQALADLEARIAAGRKTLTAELHPTTRAPAPEPGARWRRPEPEPAVLLEDHTDLPAADLEPEPDPEDDRPEFSAVAKSDFWCVVCKVWHPGHSFRCPHDVDAAAG